MKNNENIFKSITSRPNFQSFVYDEHRAVWPLRPLLCRFFLVSCSFFGVSHQDLCVFLLLGYCQLDFYYSSESFDCYIGRNWLVWRLEFLLWRYLCAQDQQMECWKSAFPNIQLLDHEDKDTAQQHSKHCLLHTATSRGWPIFWEESSPDVFLLRFSNCILINFISILVI